MPDLLTTLAQLLGQREQERPNLNPQAPSTIPGTRGLFARRPVPMPRNMGMLDVQPVPIEQALNRQSAQIFPDRAGMGVRGWQQGPNGSWSMEPVSPPAPRQRPVPDTNPGAYANFAEYANASTGGVGLGGSSAVVEQPREPLPQSEGSLRGVEPPTAPVAGPRATDLENDAWNAALARTRGRMRFEGERERQRLPRPGQPLIAQAWADQGGLMGGLVGLEGSRLNPNRGNNRGRR